VVIKCHKETRAESGTCGSVRAVIVVMCRWSINWCWLSCGWVLPYQGL